MHTNTGDQMANVTTYASPLADLTREQSWNLDALGNWTGLSENDGPTESRTHNLQNEITGIGSTTLAYDANGNLTTDEQRRTLVWDAWNRLVQVKQGSTVLISYKYDGLKRRVIEDTGTQAKHLYYSDNWQVLEEQVNGTPVAQYVWSGVYVDAMLLRDRDADTNPANGLEQRLYVLHDANFNVTALADNAGAIVERYYYEAYGKATILASNFVPRSDAQSDYAWQYLHQGGRLDNITNNYHFRNRDRSPTLGRWLNQDPIGFQGGDANLYRYLTDNVTNKLDPSGLSDLVHNVLDYIHHVETLGTALPCAAIGSTVGACLAEVAEFTFHDAWCGNPPDDKNEVVWNAKQLWEALKEEFEYVTFQR